MCYTETMILEPVVNSNPDIWSHYSSLAGSYAAGSTVQQFILVVSKSAVYPCRFYFQGFPV
jgi:hypothetical protein